MNLTNGRRIWIWSLVLWSGVALGQDDISPLIHVNQLGYRTSMPKAAMADSAIVRPFSLIDAKTQKPVLKKNLRLSQAHNPASGTSVWIADFSSVDVTGEFYLSIPGQGRSHPFVIADTPYTLLAYKVLNSYYALRCGTELPMALADRWERKACHLADAIISPPTEELIQSADRTGGWHEGGEHGKYTVSGAFSVGLLLLTHEMFPSFYPDQALKIPEAGNGIPDILDEARWELEWLLKMQQESGAVAHKLTALEPVINAVSAADESKRYQFGVSTNATAISAAVFAKASRFYSPFDATFAMQCNEAAQRAWKFLETDGLQPGFSNPEGVQTKTYNDDDDSDERLWAAVELFLLTQDARFLRVVQALADRRIPFISSSGYWGNVMPMATAAILSCTPETIGKDLHKEALDDLDSLARLLYQKTAQDGYRLSIQEGEFIWGSNATVLENAIVLLLAAHFQNQADYKAAAQDQLHYILGRNPLSVCYVTGAGVLSPQKPLFPDGLLGNAKAPVPGMVVAGPNQFLNDSVLKGIFTTTTPPARIYHDSMESFSSNEVSINWNAALVYVLTALSQ
ncbi:MAG: glycoside hydrolase family 9 protein [bacterium]|jgi:endoglucanase|nr:glycoside hydrolase family 9 protein [bacterium]